jgi:ParB-like chromosome segregation protein Spo0J
MKPVITFPCLQVYMVSRDRLRANHYNPNSVPPDRMELLQQSICDNGFCYPLVTVYDAEEDCYIIVDGFHRWTICQPEWLDLSEVPIIVLQHALTQRMIATKQFNAARGVHQIDLDADLVRALAEQGMSDEEIAVHLGMELETVHRYKSLTGIAELFRHTDYSMSWKMVDE